jgi:hypothetical protein
MQSGFARGVLPVSWILPSHSKLCHSTAMQSGFARGALLGFTMVLGLKPPAMRDAIGVVTEFMVIVEAPCHAVRSNSMPQ